MIRPTVIRAGADAICWANPTGHRRPGGPPCEVRTRTAVWWSDVE
jgi:hypothetical protein